MCLIQHRSLSRTNTLMILKHPTTSLYDISKHCKHYKVLCRSEKRGEWLLPHVKFCCSNVILMWHYDIIGGSMWLERMPSSKLLQTELFLWINIRWVEINLLESDNMWKKLKAGEITIESNASLFSSSVFYYFLSPLLLIPSLLSTSIMTWQSDMGSFWTNNCWQGKLMAIGCTQGKLIT